MIRILKYQVKYQVMMCQLSPVILWQIAAAIVQIVLLIVLLYYAMSLSLFTIYLVCLEFLKDLNNNVNKIIVI